MAPKPPKVKSPPHTLKVPVIGPEDLRAACLAAPPTPRPQGPGLQAVLFDLDGVLVHTAEFHYLAWQRLADELHLPFNRQRNEAFRGIGRMECLDKLLGPHARTLPAQEKQILADRKNAYYLAMVQTLQPHHVAPGVRTLISHLRSLGIGIALVSASRNARRVIELLHIEPWFEVIIDGNSVQRGKPDPEGFLLAADRLRVPYPQCLVIEDAEAGIHAALAAGMKTVAVASPSSPAAELADLTVGGLQALDALELAALWPNPSPHLLAG